jgi:hypothetical protein
MFWLKININAYIVFFTLVKKCVKISKRYSESVHQRTDNTMATRYQQGVNFPGFKKLFDKGIRTEYTTVEFPSLSIPNYYTLMTGKMFENGTMIGKQTTQWSQDTKEVLRIRTSKDRQHNSHKIPKGYSESVHQRTDNTMATRYQRGTQNPYMCCLSFDVRILSTPLVSCGHCVVCPLMYGF